MHPMLPQKTFSNLQKALGISEVALKRLLGSTPVPIPQLNSQGSYDIGLRLITLSKEDSPTNLNESAALSICKEYSNVCPLVYRWLCRGDFNPRKIPEDLTRAKILHACRTTGRLRASLLKSP